MKTKYEELWKYQSQLGEALYEMTEREYEDLYENIKLKFLDAYGNNEITKEQYDKLVEEILS